MLEILVALTVLGFLMTGLTQGVRVGLQAWERQSRQVAGRAELDAVERVLRRLLERMDPGTRTAPTPVAGTAATLAFATDWGPSGSPSPPSAGAAAVAGREAEVALGLEEGRLVLRWRPRRAGLPLAPPPPPATEVLLRGVAGLELSYWGGGEGEVASWRATWAGPRPPRLVRLRLRFPPGDPRRWPDLVAAPAREPADR